MPAQDLLDSTCEAAPVSNLSHDTGETRQNVMGNGKINFSEIIREHGQNLRDVIRGILRDYPGYVDDVFQCAALKIWRNLKQFKGNSKLGTWLHSIAVCEALMFLRHQ